VAALLGDQRLADDLEGGQCFNFYLSPKDYHRVHSPVDGTVVSVRRVLGDLWPVNDWSWQRVPGLFTVNERLVVELATSMGKVVVVLVGAFNVGRVTTAFNWPSDSPVDLQAGSHLGTFGMGSSVVVLYQPSVTGALSLARSEGEVRMGQNLFN